jgi:hypothetical protein
MLKTYPVIDVFSPSHIELPAQQRKFTYIFEIHMGFYVNYDLLFIWKTSFKHSSWFCHYTHKEKNGVKLAFLHDPHFSLLNLKEPKCNKIIFWCSIFRHMTLSLYTWRQRAGKKSGSAAFLCWCRARIEIIYLNWWFHRLIKSLSFIWLGLRLRDIIPRIRTRNSDFIER